MEASQPPEPPAGRPSLTPSFFFTPHGWPYLLVPFIPLAVALELGHAGAGLIFSSAALGVIPTAALMGRATEEVAARSGPGIGGLLNVTFGNAPELIIALFALEAGLQEVVKASIIGSILGNILLVMGAAMLAGGLTGGRKVQRFDRTAANVQSLMLFLAVAAMVLPAIFELVEGQGLPGIDQERVNFDSTVEDLSLAVAIVLVGTYSDDDQAHDDTWGWSIRTSVIALATAGIAVGVMSEILVGSIEAASESIGLSQFFIGVIVVAIVGNAAEHWVAVLVAIKDKMDLSVNIAIGSSAQVALFVAPVLVITSFFLGPGPMPLVFNGFEIAAIVLGVLVAYQVTNEGESNWFEGVQLLALYAILGLTFYYA
jgi:Ca2+:H+ antiporter